MHDTSRDMHGTPDIGEIVLAAVAVPATLFVSQFVGGLAKGVAEDTYRAMKKGAADLLRTRQRRFDVAEIDRSGRAIPLTGGGVNPKDAIGGPLLVLEPDLPLKAFAILLSDDWRVWSTGLYEYDRKSGTWEPASPRSRAVVWRCPKEAKYLTVFEVMENVGGQMFCKQHQIPVAKA